MRWEDSTGQTQQVVNQERFDQLMKMARFLVRRGNVSIKTVDERPYQNLIRHTLFEDGQKIAGLAETPDKLYYWERRP